MHRLGKNDGRYHGEAIDIDAVQSEAHELALATGWTCETFLELPRITLRAYFRSFPETRRNLYIAAGIHGDEPAGPITILGLLRENRWPDANIWLVPCLNPTGFRLNTRENDRGIDLNRDYKRLASQEVSAHVAWLSRQPRFDLSLLFHEDWEANGFYVYEMNPEKRPSLAEPMIEAVRAACPIETAESVDDFVCNAGIIRPQFKPEDRPLWAEATYLIANKTPLNYTLETPSDYPLQLRVKAHKLAAHEAFRVLQDQPE